MQLCSSSCRPSCPSSSPSSAPTQTPTPPTSPCQPSRPSSRSQPRTPGLPRGTCGLGRDCVDSGVAEALVRSTNDEPTARRERTPLPCVHAAAAQRRRRRAATPRRTRRLSVGEGPAIEQPLLFGDSPVVAESALLDEPSAVALDDDDDDPEPLELDAELVLVVSGATSAWALSPRRRSGAARPAITRERGIRSMEDNYHGIFVGGAR